MKTLLSRFSLATLFAVLILFNIIDAVMTALLVAAHGPIIEGNPIMRTLIEMYGAGALFGFKYFLLSILGLVLLMVKDTHHVLVAKYTLWFVTVCYGLVVLYHAFLVLPTINT